MHRSSLSMALVAAASLGCGETSSNQPTTGLRAQIPPYAPGTGFEVCRKVSDDLQGTSSTWSLGAWTVGVVASALVVSASLVSTGGSDAKWYRQAAGPLMSVTGGSLGALSAFAYSRSDGASQGAMLATGAMALDDDRAAYRQCVEAKATWLGSRIGAGRKATSDGEEPKGKKPAPGNSAEPPP